MWPSLLLLLPPLLLIILTTTITPLLASGEFVQELKVSEGAPAGTRVGFIGDGVPAAGDAPYFIVGGVEDLSVDETTGEIRTRRKLDRETRSSYSFVAVGKRANVRVVVQGEYLLFIGTILVTNVVCSSPFI